MARIKPDPCIVADRAQCEGAMAEMAALDRRLSTIENEMQEAVDSAKSKASQLAGPLQARRKELADAVAVFARLNRQELFAKSKSLDMGFGVIGFRASTRIVQMRKERSCLADCEGVKHVPIPNIRCCQLDKRGMAAISSEA